MVWLCPTDAEGRTKIENGHVGPMSMQAGKEHPRKVPRDWVECLYRQEGDLCPPYLASGTSSVTTCNGRRPVMV